MICGGRHAFDAQEKQAPWEITLLVLPITCEHSEYKQTMWIVAIYNFMVTFQLCAKGIFAVKVKFKSNAFVDHSSIFPTPLSFSFHPLYKRIGNPVSICADEIITDHTIHKVVFGEIPYLVP